MPMNLVEPQTCKCLPRQAWQVGEPFVIPVRHEALAASGIGRQKSLTDVGANLKSGGSDAWAQPGQHVSRCRSSALPSLHQCFQDTTGQTSPASMCGCNPLPFRIAEQHRQAIGDHDGAGHPWCCGDARVGLDALNVIARQGENPCAMHLIQKNRAHSQPVLQQGPVVIDPLWIVAHMGAQVQAGPGLRRDTALSRAHEGLDPRRRRPRRNKS